MKLSTTSVLPVGWCALTLRSADAELGHYGPRAHLVFDAEAGPEFHLFTTLTIGPNANLRVVLEALAGRAIGTEVDTDDLLGATMLARLIAPPADPGRRRLAEVKALDGTMRADYRATANQTWSDAAAEASTPAAS